MGEKPGRRTSSLEEASPANYICPSQDSDSLKSPKRPQTLSACKMNCDKSFWFCEL
jgi:hypothetical protein